MTAAGNTKEPRARHMAAVHSNTARQGADSRTRPNHVGGTGKPKHLHKTGMVQMSCPPGPPKLPDPTFSFNPKRQACVVPEGELPSTGNIAPRTRP